MYDMQVIINGKNMSPKADRSKLALVTGIDVYRSEGLDNLHSRRENTEDFSIAEFVFAKSTNSSHVNSTSHLDGSIKS